MNRVLTIALLATFGLAAQAPAKTTHKARTTKTHAKAAAAKPPAPKAIVIPKEATARPDGTYAWTDKAGKSWIFVRTPFGVMKTAAEGSPATASMADAKAVDAGDKVRFETKTPFG